jgi:hypothetical protein
MRFGFLFLGRWGEVSARGKDKRLGGATNQASGRAFAWSRNNGGRRRKRRWEQAASSGFPGSRGYQNQPFFFREKYSRTNQDEEEIRHGWASFVELKWAIRSSSECMAHFSSTPNPHTKAFFGS